MQLHNICLIKNLFIEDKKLRKGKHLPNVQIETDSYVAVQLLEQQGKLDFGSLKSMAESVQGSFCFIALDENNTLYIVKGSNPMCLLHFAELGLYVYASTESILKKALQKAGFHKYPFEVLHVEEGMILKIDRYGFLTCSAFEVQESFRFGKWADWYDELEEEYYTQHRGRSVFQGDKVAQGHRRRGAKSVHCERSYAAVY